MLNIKKIYEIMELKGIKTLRDLAVQSHIPYTTLHYMFSGHDMKVGTLIELARFLKEPLEELINKNYEYVIYEEKDGKTYKKIAHANNLYEVALKYMM